MTAQLQKVTSSATFTVQVLTALRAAIRSGELPTGVTHSVAEIAAQLDVSRTPVREAVLQLAKLGLVEIRKNKGFVVIEHDRTDVERIFQIRRWLEVPAAGLAAGGADAEAKQRIQDLYDLMLAAADRGDFEDLQRYDARFHAAILDVVENPRLTEIIDDLRALLVARRHLTGNRSRSLTDIVHDHERICRAVVEGDPARAELEMAAHLELTRRGVLALFGEAAPR